jgi:hypothetical protein
MSHRIFVDTEWTAAPWEGPAELMWIGLADQTGRSWYGISAEADIDPSTNSFIAGAFRLISPHEPRLSRVQLAEAVFAFCGNHVDEFWAWVPSLQSFTEWSGLGAQAAEVLARYWDIDLQMLRTLVVPWPNDWPEELQDLNSAATAAHVQVPPREPNHLHPRVHAEWNSRLFGLIRAAQRQ